MQLQTGLGGVKDLTIPLRARIKWDRDCGNERMTCSEPNFAFMDSSPKPEVKVPLLKIDSAQHIILALVNFITRNIFIKSKHKATQSTLNAAH